MIEIKNRYTGKVIHTMDADSLIGADLRWADLTGADLIGADLYGASGILSIGPIGNVGRIINAVAHKDTAMIQAGCFWGTVDEFETAIQEKYKDGPAKRAYLATVPLIRAWYEANREGE